VSGGAGIAALVAAEIGRPEPSPGMVEVLRESFRVRPRPRSFVAARSRSVASALLLVLLAVTVVVSVARGLVLRARIEGLRETAFWLVPNLHLEGGVLHADGSQPRLLEDDAWVLWIDTRAEPAPPPRAAPGDRRTRYVLRDTALLVYEADRPVARVLPWGPWHALGDPLDLDGPAVVTRAAGLWPLLAAVAGTLGFVAGAVLSLALAALLGSSWAAIGGCGPYAPSAAAFFRLGVGAVVPALPVAGVALLFGLPQAIVGTVAALLGALRFAQLIPGAQLRDEPRPA
jgi:hypothetical protein